MIISVLNQKGGVGKTTLAYNIAFEMANKGKEVLLVDSDTQASATKITLAREQQGLTDIPFTVVTQTTKAIMKEVKKLEPNYDIVIIDGVPSVAEVTQATLMISDMVIMPLSPVGVDLWATQELISALTKAKIMNDNLVSAVLLNRFEENQIIAKEILEMAEAEEWSIFDTRIAYRVAYQKSATYGFSVRELQDKKAITEIENVVQEILETMGH